MTSRPRSTIVLVLLALLARERGAEAAAPDGGRQEETAETPAPAATSSPELEPYGLRRFAYDTRFLFTRPFHLDSRGRLRLAATAAAGLALYGVRPEIREYAQDHRSPGRDAFLDAVRTMGKGAFAPSVALVAYLSSFATHDDREKETAQLVLTSTLYSGLVAVAGQFVLSTQRPYQGDEIRFFHTGGHGVSGDAALAASIVAPLRHQYLVVRPEDRTGKRFLKRSATVVLYAGAALTSCQRINADAHWAPDAFLGTMAGLTVGEVLSAAHDGSRTPSVVPSITAVPGGAVLLVTIPLDRHYPLERDDLGNAALP